MPSKKSAEPAPQRQKLAAYDYDPQTCDIVAANLRRIFDHFEPLSYERVARDLGVSADTLRSYTTRKPPNTPNLVFAMHLARYFGGLTANDLLDPGLDVSKLDRVPRKPSRSRE